MSKSLIILISFLAVFSLYAQYGAESRELDSEESKIVVVKEGDTLWDLCEQYLGDPFLWPKIWALNPQVENPHLIEPGDKIKFNLKTGEMKIMPKNQMNATNINNFDDESFNKNTGVTVADKKNFMFSNRKNNNTTNQVTVRNEALLTDKKFKKSGKISSSKEEKVLLSRNDEVYLKFKNLDKIKPGDKYNVYKIRKKLKHPLRDKEYGYLIDILGELTISGKTKSKAIAVITNSYQEIERGDYVVPKIDLALSVEKISSPRRIDGHIIDFSKKHDNIANKELAFIDKGSNDGIKKGMILRIIRDKDPITNEYIPTFQIGKLIVMSTNKNTSTVFIMVATQNIKKGDRITTQKARENKKFKLQ